MTKYQIKGRSFLWFEIFHNGAVALASRSVWLVPLGEMVAGLQRDKERLEGRLEVMGAEQQRLRQLVGQLERESKRPDDGNALDRWPSAGQWQNKNEIQIFLVL